MISIALHNIIINLIKAYITTTNNYFPFKYLKNIFRRYIDAYHDLYYCRQLGGIKNIHFNYPVNFIQGDKSNISIGQGTGFGKFAVLTAWNDYYGQKYSPKIEIGSNCYFGDYINISRINSIKIGNNVLTGKWVTIVDNNHGKTKYDELHIAPMLRKLSVKGSTIIEDNVWIGDKATVLSGVTIGECSIIAANSVVTKDIPKFSVAAGNPAKIIKIMNELH